MTARRLGDSTGWDVMAQDQRKHLPGSLSQIEARLFARSRLPLIGEVANAGALCFLTAGALGAPH